MCRSTLQIRSTFPQHYTHTLQQFRGIVQEQEIG